MNTELEVKSEDFARLGYISFINASRDYPASAIAQGAAIALYCSKRNLDPFKLRDSLLGNEELIKELHRLANQVHERNNVRSSGKPLKISLDSVKIVVRADFEIAKGFMDKGIHDLPKILNIYKNAQRNWFRRLGFIGMDLNSLIIRAMEKQNLYPDLL